MGLFIAFEGCDASGKTTQARLLADRLGARLTREPGDTAVGARLRSLVLDHSPEGASLDVRTEALLMAADRAQHVAEVVRPALAAGEVVISDRYIGSSLAYQGFGRGLAVDDVRRLSAWATDGLWPAVTVLLRVPVGVVMARLGAASAPDRLESAGEGFLRRVIDGFDVLAGLGSTGAAHGASDGGDLPDSPAEPGSWRAVDGIGDLDEVAARVWEVVEPFVRDRLLGRRP